MPDDSIAPSGTLEQDLNNLASILDDNVPAYVLVRLDDPPSEWLAVFYVPDTAKVRDKVCGHSILLGVHSIMSFVDALCLHPE